tara:strand:+ start:3969 stop:5087 length:1119 start_codon:yes stop_codon:yes gene_type:complete
MAKSYEPLNPNTDVTTTRTLLHEAIPLTGTIISGTYGVWPDEGNVKNFTHGMFQSVYDYPYLSSSANHIFDISVGYDDSSALSESLGNHTQNGKKIAIYNQFSQLLVGYNEAGNAVEIFESDLDITNDDRQMKECVFIPFSRMLTKDQIKKGTFTIELGTSSFDNAMGTSSAHSGNRIKLQDLKASSAGDVGTAVGGEYGVLFDATGGVGTLNTSSHGVVFYQAGIVVLSASAFNSSMVDFASGAATMTGATAGTGPARSVDMTLKSSSISGTCDAVRHRIYNISYNNSTEINSTIYFCRMPVNKFNYSANPTYTSASKLVVKNVATDIPVTYVTTIGLYSANNELLATAKLSEPLRKDPTNEITLRVRLDY